MSQNRKHNQNKKGRHEKTYPSTRPHNAGESTHKTRNTFITYTDELKKLLCDNKGKFTKLDSASLRHTKFLSLGGDGQKVELAAVADLACQHRPIRIPQLPGAVEFSLILGGRLAINTSTGVLENAGMALHRFYNVPYIPGSALKGIARHYAWTLWQNAKPEEKDAINRAAFTIFGSAFSTSEKDQDNQKGGVSFLPAWPNGDWKLVVDVLTPHGGNDYTNPIPCFFLTVERGAKFTFTLHKLSTGSDEDVQRAKEWLTEGLISHGVGAKTIAGYGWFKNDEPMQNSATLTLDTPGFFGGAFQYGEKSEQDTVLRPSSIRGMLRWWWRALWRDYLKEGDHKKPGDLKKLEDFLWGSTENSGIIHLHLHPESKTTPFLFDYKDGYKLKQTFAKCHNIDADNNGLLYLAYGMDEKSHGEIKQRYYCEQGSRWNIQFSLRNNKNQYQVQLDKPVTITGKEILNQANVALSLLCQFGGVGSKSRKGFGSLNWVDAWKWDKCRDEAKNLCQKWQISPLSEPQDYGLKYAIKKEVQVPHTDPWKILDTVGLAVKHFASTYKHNADKAVLGLPRQIHGPKENPLDRQNKNTHNPPEYLEPLFEKAKQQSKKDNRFASPLWIHLNKSEKGMILRLTAFPSGQIGKMDTSKKLLTDIINNIESELNKTRWENIKPQVPMQHHRNVPLQNTMNGKKAGDKIEVELIEEKTKKGGWKAKWPEKDIVGSIFNSDEVKGKVGDVITVVIQSANERDPSFRAIKE